MREAMPSDCASASIAPATHRDIIEPAGAGFVARRADADCEILASKDNFFRPVHLGIGPDGGLVACDFYREAIETPLSLPEDILKRLRLETQGRGRIWRIRDGNFKPKADAAPTTVSGLVAWLADPNPWRRNTAQRILIEKADGAAPAAIKKNLNKDLPWVGWIHGLWTLERLGALDNALVRAGLEHARAEVREQAAVLAGHSEERARAMAPELALVATDPAPRVRLQAIASMGAKGHASADTIAAALERDGADPWISLAALSLATGDHGGILEAWVKLTGGKAPSPTARDAIGRLSVLAGDGTMTDRASFLKAWSRLPESWQAPALVGLANSKDARGLPLFGAEPVAEVRDVALVGDAHVLDGSVLADDQGRLGTVGPVMPDRGGEVDPGEDVAVPDDQVAVLLREDKPNRCRGPNLARLQQEVRS